MRGRGAWSHSLSGPKRAAQTPDSGQGSQFFFQTGPESPVPFCRRDSLAWPGNRSVPAGPWVEQPFSGIGHSSASSPPHPHREL